MSNNSQLDARQQWDTEKPKLDAARRLRGIFDIESDDKEFDNAIKNARRKVPFPKAMRIPWARVAVDRGMGHIQKFASLARIQSQNQKRSNRVSSNRRQNSSFFQRLWAHAAWKILIWTRLHVDRNSSHVFFLMYFARLIVCSHHIVVQDEPRLNVSLCAFHSIFMPSMMCVLALLVLVLSFSCFSPSSTSSLPHSTCSLPDIPSSMSTPPRVKTTALTQNEQYCFPWRYTIFSQVLSPSYSTTPTNQKLMQWSSRMNLAT